MVVLPDWLDQAPTINFEPEKAMLTQIENWAQQNGWTVSDGHSLPLAIRQRTDVLLERPDLDQRVRIAVLRKSKRGVGVIRLDASTLRTLELVFQPKKKFWRVEIEGVPLDDRLLENGLDPLFTMMFRR